MMIDHLTGAGGEQIRPKHEEISEVIESLILPVAIQGDWVMVSGGSERSTSMKFVVSNWKEIDAKKMELESNKK